MGKKKNKGSSELKIGVRPLYDRVLLKRIEASEQARGGIIIPDTAREKPMEAEVIAAGSGRVGENGESIPLTVAVGDRVLVGTYAGTEVQIAEEGYLVVREDEILARVLGQ